MKQLHEKLKREEFRFCLVGNKSKAAIEKAWTTENNYKYDNPKLLQHIENNGNYGVIGGYHNLIILDKDDQRIQKCLDQLPPTFTVKTGTGKTHKYYFTDNTKSWKIRDEQTGSTLIDFQGQGKYVVGPDSIHPNGTKYEVLEDIDICTINHTDLLRAFSEYLKPNITNKPKTSLGVDKVRDEIKQKYKISDYLADIEIDINKNPTDCPFHESIGGKCLSYDDTKGVWHCFHCEKNGDLFSLYMEKENITFYKAKQELSKKLGINVSPANAQTKAQLELELAKTYIENHIEDLFCDQFKTSWITYYDGIQKKTHMVDSSLFLDWLRLLLDENGFGKEQLNDYLKKLLISRARRGNVRELFLREFTDENDNFVIQIDDNHAAEITQTGSVNKIESNEFFRIFEHQQPYEIDFNAKKEDLHLIDKFTNFDGENNLMFYKMCLPVYKVPHIQKSSMLVFGPPGSAKSILSRITVMLIDPSNLMNMGMGFPEKLEDWALIAREHSFFFFDNLNNLNKKQQDEVCKAVTGTSVKKRKLYTDTDMVQLKIQTTGILNAIELKDLQNDFLDRMIKFDLKRVSNDKRKGEQKFMKEFEECVPKIRGAILKILADARVIFKDLKLQQISEARLSDYAKWTIACGLSLGYKQEDCEQLLQEKIVEQQDSALEQSRLAEPIIKLLSNNEDWQGTATDLLEILTKQEFGEIIGSGSNEMTVVRNKPQWWFNDPASIGIELRRIEFLLRSRSIYVSKKKSNGKLLTVISKNPNLDVKDYKEENDNGGETNE